MAYYNFDDNVGGPDPIYIKCQYCHGEGPTRVESKTATWRQRLNASMAGTIMALTCCCPCSLMCCCLPPLWCCMMPLCGFKINKHYCQSCGTRVYKVCCPYYWCSHLKLSVKLQRVVFLILKIISALVHKLVLFSLSVFRVSLASSVFHTVDPIFSFVEDSLSSLWVT